MRNLPLAVAVALRTIGWARITVNKHSMVNILGSQQLLWLVSCIYFVIIFNKIFVFKRFIGYQKKKIANKNVDGVKNYFEPSVSDWVSSANSGDEGIGVDFYSHHLFAGETKNTSFRFVWNTSSFWENKWIQLIDGS